MSLGGIGLTLYDFLGYLLPGYVCLLALSLLESTFVGSNLFALSIIAHNVAPFSVAAYFLGHICHAVGSLLRDRFRPLFTNRGRLSPQLDIAVRQAIGEVYKLGLAQDRQLNSLEEYMLADNYTVASKVIPERDIMMAREGFYKASMVAFLFVSIVFVASLATGGVVVATSNGQFTRAGIWFSAALALVSILVTLLFRTRFAFYSRVKSNNTLLLFLTLHRTGSGKPER